MTTNTNILFTSENDRYASCPNITGPVTMRVEWSSGQITETACATVSAAYEVVGGEAHPFERWEISAPVRAASELWPQLCKMAESDMRRARKEGSILICNTRRGTVELRYVSGRRYELRTLGAESVLAGDSPCIALGAAAAVRDSLAALYAIAFA